MPKASVYLLGARGEEPLGLGDRDTRIGQAIVVNAALQEMARVVRIVRQPDGGLPKAYARRIV